MKFENPFFVMFLFAVYITKKEVIGCTVDEKAYLSNDFSERFKS
ncbi:hypothetical protein A343_0718 [Porphyromonas gingivalis JCVI SC001]|nr:hypothetical protein A343_0718 [Porphyromonas gingivalis JCVI SC001]